VIGICSIASAVPDRSEEMLLSVMVLTSDDVFFSAGLSASLEKGLGNRLEELYANTLPAAPEKPRMMLTLTPPLLHIAGDDIVARLDAASGGTPNFGSFSVNYGDRLKDSEIIFNGELYTDRLAIVLLSGNIEPVFTVHSLSEEKVIKQNAIITKSDNNVVMEINGIPASAYMESLGFSKEDRLNGLYSIPFVVEFAGGASVVRTILDVSPEGYLIFGGAVPVGCTISAGPIDFADVLKTAEAAAARASSFSPGGLLFFSCLVRSLALGLDTTAEMEKIREGVKIPFMFAYSGGEICPAPDREGKLINCFHNVSIISWGFK
jgi:hypothetical protein